MSEELGRPIARGYVTIVDINDGEPAQVYKLVPSVGSVTRKLNGTLSVSLVGCSVYKITGKGAYELTDEKELVWRRLPDKTAWQTAAHPEGLTTTLVAVKTDTERIDFELRDGTAVLERVSVNVFVDASDLEEGIDKYKYLFEATSEGETTTNKGLILSSLIMLRDSSKTVWSGINGTTPLGERSIAAWYGGDMEDRFEYDASTGRYKEKTTIPARAAMSIDRMDGTGYRAGGNMRWERDGSVTFGNGIKIDLGGGTTTLGTLNNNIASLLSQFNNLANKFYPVDSNMQRLSWGSDPKTWHSIKSEFGLWTEQFLSAKGLSSGSGSGSGSQFGLYTNWLSTPQSTDALGAVLGKSLYTQQNRNTSDIASLKSRVTTLEGKNYLSDLTLSPSGSGNAVTAVSLSADKKTLTVTKGSSFALSSHTHSQYLTSVTATNTYVTLNTDQNINGIKSFTHSQRFINTAPNTSGWSGNAGNGFYFYRGTASESATNMWMGVYSGSVAQDGVVTERYMALGWGQFPWAQGSSFAVCDSFIRYKGYTILHGGNYSSILDSRYQLKNSALGFSINPNYLAARFNNVEFAKKASSTYIECWQSWEGGDGWFNYRLGDIYAIGEVKSANGFIKVGGTSAQFLKADGSVDGTSYAPNASLNSHTGNTTVHITSSERTAWNNKVDKVSGKGLSTNDFDNTLLAKLNGIEPGANKYVLPTASASVLGGVKVGSGLAISSGVLAVSLSASHIPNLSWSKITSGKPTTLAGYGITDAKISGGVITLGSNTITPLVSHQPIYSLTFAAGLFVAKTFNPKGAAATVNIPTHTTHIAEGTNKYFTDARAVAALKSTTDALRASINTKLDASKFDKFLTLFNDMFERVNIGTTAAPVYAIHAKKGLYTDQFLTAKGRPSGLPGDSGSGSSQFGLMRSWPSSSPGADTTDALGANLGYQLYINKADKLTVSGLSVRLAALEQKNYLDNLAIAVSGSGNAVTAVSQSADKKTLTFTKGSTFLTSHQSLANYVTLNTTQTISGAKTFGNNIRTSSPHGSWLIGKTEAAIMFNGLTAIDSSSVWYFYNMKSASGHTIAFGGLGDNIGFYTFLADRTENSTDSSLVCNTATGQWTTNKNFTAYGFVKTGSSNSYVLLGGGGHKALSDISSAYVTALGTNGNYLTWTKNGSVNNITVPYATNANQLTRNTRMDYGWNGLNYFNASLSAGCAAKTNDAPTTQWWHILRFNHANSTGFYTDLAVPLNSNSLYWKCVKGGSLAHSSWVKILDDLNYSSILDARYYTESEINTKLTNGSVTKVGTSTVGSGTKPMYLNGGVPTACTYAFGNGSGNAALNNGTVNTNLNADKLDGKHAGVQNGEVAIFISFATPTALINAGYLESNYADLGHPDDKYFKALCKWVIATYPSGGNFIGNVSPSSTGYCHMHVYNSGKGSDGNGGTADGAEATLPRYCSGTYYTLTGNQKTFGTYKGKWSWNCGYFSGKASSAATANSAAKLSTPRSINGSTFDGTASITTVKWGTARNIGILSNDGTSTPSRVSVDGSGNVDLRLPATIKAALTGNATTATSLQTARTLTVGNTGKVFNGTANVTWSLDEIGVYSKSAADSRYVNVSGDTMTGLLTTTSGNHGGLKIGGSYLTANGNDMVLQVARALRFGADAWDANQWAGLKYTHTTKTIALGIADGTEFIANTAQTGGTLKLVNCDLLLGGGDKITFGSDDNAYLNYNSEGKLVLFGKSGINLNTNGRPISANANIATTGTFSSSSGGRSSLPNLSVSYANNSYTLSTSSFICNSWVRTVGSSGWYSETYGGGWRMTDSTYIRNYGTKRVLLDAGAVFNALQIAGGGVYIDNMSGNNVAHNYGYGALTVGIKNDSSQSPLIVACRQNQSLSGSTRLFAMELHNTGSHLCFGFGGSTKFCFQNNGVLYATGGMYTDGFMTAKTAGSSSDARLKTNIRELCLPLETIVGAPSVAFDWKDGKGRGAGTIAQYWRDKLPEVLLTDPEGFYSVSYGQLAHVEISSLAKHLVPRMEKAEDKIIRLERRIAILEKALAECGNGKPLGPRTKDRRNNN